MEGRQLSFRHEIEATSGLLSSPRVVTLMLLGHWPRHASGSSIVFVKLSAVDSGLLQIYRTSDALPSRDRDSLFDCDALATDIRGYMHADSLLSHEDVSLRSFLPVS